MAWFRRGSDAQGGSVGGIRATERHRSFEGSVPDTGSGGPVKWPPASAPCTNRPEDVRRGKAQPRPRIAAPAHVSMVTHERAREARAFAAPIHRGLLPGSHRLREHRELRELFPESRLAWVCIEKFRTIARDPRKGRANRRRERRRP